MLFALPGGVWVLSNGPTAERLAAHFQRDPSPPPVSPLEPTALIVEQDAGGWALEDMLAGDSILATTTATFAGAAGADVPALVRCEFPDATRASAAAADIASRYLRARPIQPQRVQYQPVAYFMATLQQSTADGPSLLLRGALPYGEVSDYLRD